MQGQQNEVLLTNSPCVGWLCKVFWHLPVDVKPEKGKVTAIKQVEYFNTFHVPTGMNDAERFSIQLSNSIFSVCRRMWKGKTKQKKRVLFLLYNYVTALLFGSSFQSTSLHLPLLRCHGSLQSELLQVPGKKSRWTSLQTTVKGKRYSTDSWI